MIWFSISMTVDCVEWESTDQLKRTDIKQSINSLCIDHHIRYDDCSGVSNGKWTNPSVYYQFFFLFFLIVSIILCTLHSVPLTHFRTFEIKKEAFWRPSRASPHRIGHLWCNESKTEELGCTPLFLQPSIYICSVYIYFFFLWETTSVTTRDHRFISFGTSRLHLVSGSLKGIGSNYYGLFYFRSLTSSIINGGEEGSIYRTIFSSSLFLL